MLNAIDGSENHLVRIKGLGTVYAPDGNEPNEPDGALQTALLAGDVACKGKKKTPASSQPPETPRSGGLHANYTLSPVATHSCYVRSTSRFADLVAKRKARGLPAWTACGEHKEAAADSNDEEQLLIYLVPDLRVDKIERAKFLTTVREYARERGVRLEDAARAQVFYDDDEPSYS